MKSKRVTFTGSLGDPLQARFDLPDDENPSSCALFAHCFTCSKNLTAVSNISRVLTSLGIGVFRFDFTGLGESGGDFSDTTFSSNVDDLVSASDFLKKDFTPPQILIGHSLGGAAVLQASHQIASCKGVVTIAAPCNPAHVEKLLEGRIEEIRERGEATVVLAGRRFKVKKAFLDDLEEAVMNSYIEELKKPLLVFHSPFDGIVGIENAAHIFLTAKHPKSFISLDDADHLLSREKDSHYVGEVTAAWMSRYI